MKNTATIERQKENLKERKKDNTEEGNKKKERDKTVKRDTISLKKEKE